MVSCLGDHHGAIADCTDALKLDPTNTTDFVSVSKAAADAERAACAAELDRLAEIDGEHLPCYVRETLH